MKCRAVMMIVTAALVWTAQSAVADADRRQYSPRILEPSFAQSEPRHFPNHMYVRPGLARPHSRYAKRIVAVPVLVPLYYESYPYDGAPLESMAPGTAPYWYFCPDSQSYYPDVPVCASGWRAFVPGTSRQAY